MSLNNPGFPRIAILTLLAVIFTAALAFATLELPVAINSLLAEHFPDIHPVIEPDKVTEFIDSIRPIGYACLGIIAALIIAGFATRKRGLSILGSFALFLPTFGYFAAHMFFLAGLGILRVPWIAFGETSVSLVNFGDISYLPYMVSVYPFWLVGLDVRSFAALFAVVLGLLIFVTGTIAWFNGKAQKKETVDFWIYRYSRHPQYLGFIIWSYGVMLFAAQTPVVRGGSNPGASLPWLISTLVIICIALAEERSMSQKDGEGYAKYKASAPFMFPLPSFLSRMLTAPVRLVLKKDQPQTGKEIALTFTVYAVILILLSLPFALLHWPPDLGWSNWPAYRLS